LFWFLFLVLVFGQNRLPNLPVSCFIVFIAICEEEVKNTLPGQTKSHRRAEPRNNRNKRPTCTGPKVGENSNR